MADRTSSDIGVKWVVITAGSLLAIVFIIALIMGPSKEKPAVTLTPAYDSLLHAAEDPAVGDSALIEKATIAYGNLKFGMNPKEVRQAIAKSNFKIGGHRYSPYPRFWSNKLYFVELAGEYMDASHYSTDVAEGFESFSDVIKEKYGQPQEGSGFPHFFQMKAGRVIYGSVWNVGTKKIALGAARGSDNALFAVIAHIYDVRMHDSVDAMKAQKKKEAAQDAAKNF